MVGGFGSFRLRETDPPDTIAIRERTMNEQYKKRSRVAPVFEHRRKLAQDAVLIVFGIQNDGTVYAIDLYSEDRIKECYPDAKPLRSLFLGHYKETEFETLNRPRWEQMVFMLTGLSAEQIAALGGVRLLDQEDHRVVWEWKPKVVSP
jgi:hypothetical protein